MQTFIRRLVDGLVAAHGERLESLCVVFPSRRACVFFKEELQSAVDRPIFAPSVYAIEDFVRESYPVTVLDTTSLAFELYPIYRETFPDEPFDRFFSWASMLISDFDELDRSLVDAKAIFRNLFDLKEIDTTIDAWLNEDGQPSEFQARYLRFWEKMAELYARLREKLDQSDFAMPGQAVRALAEKYREKKPYLPWEKVIFAGFNGLSPAEEAVIAALIDHGLAEVYWDLDRYYTEQPMQEAGRFFRDLRARWERDGRVAAGGWNWIGDRLAGSPKKITVTGVPRRVGQAKVAGLKLRDLLADGIAPERVAIVLPDENLLFPLLHSLPPELKDINVTMGFPLRHTPLFSLVEAILQLHENAERLRPGEADRVFYFRDIRNILRHPYIQSIAFDDVRTLLREMDRDNLVYLKPEFFWRYEDSHILRFIFQPWQHISQIIQYFLNLYQSLKVHLESQSQGALPTLEAEYLFQFYTLTQKLRDKLDHYHMNFDQRIFRRLYKEVVQTGSIPFAGEPLKGLQIMGMLETRVLDFDRVIILSVNENVLPAKPKNASFIPHNLRVAFGLPVQEDRDAIYAYHFYRLLQHAQEVVLMHDTEHDSFGSGERSRFIAQLEMELGRANPQLELRQETITFPTTKEDIATITVEKTPEALERLRFLGAERGFSPSAMHAYLSCSLRFYYRYVLGLKEKEEMEQSMAANTFGKVLHRSMEVLYEDFVGKVVNVADIDAMYARIPAISEDAFNHVTPNAHHHHGKNYLLLRVIRDLVAKVLDIDRRDAPFEIVGLEMNVEANVITRHNPEGVRIQGIIDRVDRCQGETRIIDYKTGSVKPLDLKDFEEVREKEEKKAALQLATYAWIFLKNHPVHKEVTAGIYHLRNLSKGLDLLRTGPALNPHQDLQSLGPFEDVIASLLDEMFSPEVPFMQTEDTRRCEYCPYKVMCVRT